MIIWALILWYLMYVHAVKIQESVAINSEEADEKEKEFQSCLAKSGMIEPFVPFLETSRTPWHILEQRYYVRNKHVIDETLNNWEKASVDIALMEHRIRRLAAALEVEKDQRRALEDRIHAHVLP